MRLILASDAESQLPGLLDDVERGETVVVIRDGKAIARIVPEIARRREEIERGIEMMKSVRQHTFRTTADEIISARDEGRRF
jgi:antitoxin (DNA-binding transcriptional repressor) of toxin-antitoxin stability system